MPNDLNPEAVGDQLTTIWLGRTYLYQTEVDSTNSRVGDLARAGGIHGTVLVADQQTHGRGRLGRHWQSPVGVNLYVSALLRPHWNVATNPLLSLVAGVAVADTAERFLPATVQLKWPNDVYCQRRKLAGILAESGVDQHRSPYVVLGIGLNVNQQQFPPPLDQQATSLRLIGGTSFSRSACLAMLLGRLEHWIDRWQSAGFADVLEQWVRRADWLGGPIKVRMGSQEFIGTAMGLTVDGGLRLRDENGHERTIHCGDVSLLLETIGRQPLSSTPSK